MTLKSNQGTTWEKMVWKHLWKASGKTRHSSASAYLVSSCPLDDIHSAFSLNHNPRQRFWKWVFRKHSSSIIEETRLWAHCLTSHTLVFPHFHSSYKTALLFLIIMLPLPLTILQSSKSKCANSNAKQKNKEQSHEAISITSMPLHLFAQLGGPGRCRHDTYQRTERRSFRGFRVATVAYKGEAKGM